ncbi:putative methanogen marker protein 4 [Candidatus Methanoperedens nitroreducens]|uniref:Putative methanogen marker protein 4 n=1 Tax=Candidatus Methanoperedens nitratireducens TaxID=1392998 RepID=A0A062V520_9EURY|nr:methanogenesis marker protein Mmp4/MtxX [Candidatus Methanoperedens nitroreducens]KCZ71713.1 putative methanogen marker protein 4 [Candidatus Methanoperedens nitroreducens]MDJ1422314.1 methanogenesis marker protein Mmp4/MtxX [Candidatus Methanoperedens sp.]
MNILSEIERRARSNHARIGLGIGEVSEKLIKSAENACEYAEVVLVGDEEKINAAGTHLEVIHSTEPSKRLIELLAEGKIDGAVRGTLSATKTLSALKKSLGINRLYRVALLETADGTPFFLAPVGIDEGNSIADKIELIKRGAEYIGRLGIEVRAGLLSGGRFEDIGRDERVDRTLADTELVTKMVCDKGINAGHYSILIEDAIKEANFIVAPDGISGNLIFRTLVFLGGGYGYGAPVLMEKVFVDTSRAKDDSTRAIMLASALKNPAI